MKRIYLDYAATGPTKPEVLKAMEPFFLQKFGNPSSLHSFGQETRAALDKARGQVAKFLNCKSGEILFTSGGTESDNLAILGVVFEYYHQAKNKPHIITSSVEHHAVLHTCQYLEKKSEAEVTYIKTDNRGLINPEDIKKAMKPNTLLVSIMYANNEIGTVEPIREIGKYIEKVNKDRDNKVYFHTDAVQAIEYLNCDVKYLHVDLLSLSAHKFGGPKGVGALFVKEGTAIKRLIHGGDQEYHRRAGTENVPGIVGLAKAIELVVRDKSKNEKIRKLRDKLIQGIGKKIPDVILTGDPKNRLLNNASFCFNFIEGESILINLDLQGVAVSTGSACSSGSLDPSHVLIACGFDHQTAQGSLRFTLGEQTTKEDIDYVLSILPDIVKKLRKMSPFGRKNVGV
ncbi:MAG: aminotransferase class V-fold PLP-dependent enzyme [Candidatus Berkelbacteria bacterium]|nr:aminotransferase class V-fold PLP-dependent enzyme [Candidatus Berkelbacteria bacterium]